MRIKKISARKILDSTGSWTVECEVELGDGIKASASVPSGVSTSPFEAETVSADQAVKNINSIANKTFQRPGLQNQAAVDKKLVELNIGANASIAVSLAVCRAAAKSSKTSLYKYINEKCQMSNVKCQIPKLMVLLFEGGKHGDGTLVSQEFMVVANDVKRAKKFYETVKNHLTKTSQSLSVGLEGGFTPNFSDKQALEILNYILGGNPLALDVAFEAHRTTTLNYQYFMGNLNVTSIEDPFGVKDWESWIEFTKGWGKEMMVVADDLTATNPERTKKAIQKQAANAVVIKPNQIGTITETLQVVKIAKDAGWKVIVSHRGQETNDSFIADLAVGVGADFVKFGGFARGERISKYNRLLEIQTEIA